MRNALELSIITQPCLVMVSANSFEVPPPADTNATSMSLKSSLCCRSFTSYSLPLKLYLLPAERCEPKSVRLSMGKFLSASMRRNSCPTAPLAPTIATFIIVCVYVCPYSLSAFSFVCIGLRVATLCFTNILQRYNFSVYMQLFERIKSHFSTFRVLLACRSGRGRFRVSCRSFPAFSGFLGFREWGLPACNI